MASDRATIRQLARDLAREITNELQNSGVITDIHEARRVLEGESNLLCKSCSNPVAVQDSVCNQCGSKQAVDADAVFYKCLDCNMPISDPNVTRCPKCRGTKVRKAGPERFECLRCGEGISDPKTTPVCPKCGEDRCVERPARGIQTVES